ncbi:MAG: hypothetical protein ABR585_02070 [Gemmatimonadaceae bacterium]
MSLALKVAWVLCLLLLLVTGAIGIYNGVTEWGEGKRLLQHSVTVGVFLYGVFGLSAAAGLFRRERWALWSTIVWGLMISYVPPAAIIAYAGGRPAIGSAIATGAGCAVIALGVIWTVHKSTERSSTVGG